MLNYGRFYYAFFLSVTHTATRITAETGFLGPGAWRLPAARGKVSVTEGVV